MYIFSSFLDSGSEEEVRIPSPKKSSSLRRPCNGSIFTKEMIHHIFLTYVAQSPLFLSRESRYFKSRLFTGSIIFVLSPIDKTSSLLERVKIHQYHKDKCVYKDFIIIQNSYVPFVHDIKKIRVHEFIHLKTLKLTVLIDVHSLKYE